MKRPYFRLGAIGMILVAITAPIYFAIYFLAQMHIIPFGVFTPFFGMVAVTAIVLYMGFIFAGIGFFGYYRTFGLVWGLVGFLFPILFGWVLFLVEVKHIITFWVPWIPSIWIPWPPFALIEELLYWILKDAFLVFAPIIWSISIFQVAQYTGKESRTLVAGALLLATGLVYLPLIIIEAYYSLFPIEIYYLVFGTGTALLCLAGLLNCVVFLSAQVTKW